jgi:hypothetical protein
MTALLVAVSVAAGIACTEFAIRTLRGGSWLSSHLRSALSLVASIRAAATDDARERALVQAGLATLLVSLAFLAWMVAIAAIVLVPGLALGSEVPLSVSYLGIASLASLGWWLVRRGRHAR